MIYSYGKMMTLFRFNKIMKKIYLRRFSKFIKNN